MVMLQYIVNVRLSVRCRDILCMLSYMSLLYFHRVFKKASPNGKVILHLFYPSFVYPDHVIMSVVLNLVLHRFSVSDCSIACYEMVMTE